jgi:hypothetical protein
VQLGLDQRGCLDNELVLQAGDEVGGVAARDHVRDCAQGADVDAAGHAGSVVKSAHLSDLGHSSPAANLISM